jgi:hypothetical protein
MVKGTSALAKSTSTRASKEGRVMAGRNVVAK